MAKKLSSDGGSDMAANLNAKADILYGQHMHILEIAQKLDKVVMGMHGEGKRAKRSATEWDHTRKMLSDWATDLYRLSEDVRAEAKKYAAADLTE
ncbi:MAG TPA: hypothetical protein VKY59_17025 [Spirillospora sp.]|nr:hypothetical protein [Spirillospora sp.]